jgi:phosphate uptake regulator
MELRKVQEMGGGTLLISLPKEWVKKNNVTKGSVITIEEKGNEYLIVYPLLKEERSIREVTIPYPAKYMEYLINDITGSYLLGYDLIKIQGKERTTYEDRERIKKAIRQLIGLEIVEEDSLSITAQFLLEPTILTPEKIFRRMHVISMGMYKDAITSFLENDEHLVKVVCERDEEVDRLHFLLVRLIRSALLDSRLLMKFDMKPIDCLDYRVASNLLEDIGDSAVDIAKNVITLPDIAFDEVLKKMISNAGETLEKIQEHAVKAFLNKSAKDARQVMKLYASLTSQINEHGKALTKKPLQIIIGLSAITSSISKIGHCHVDLADLTVPLYPLVH